MCMLALEKNLKRARLLSGYSVNNLAKETGLNSSYLSKVLNAKVSPSASTAKKIAEVLGVSVVEIFEIKEEV